MMMMMMMKLRGLPLDSCFQPVNIGQQLLDEEFADILCIAPCEGSTPLRILFNLWTEAQTFPTLFPQGLNTYHEKREQKISLKRYFHNRLMNVDNRFAQNTDYIFYAQYISEIENVMSSISIALRTGGQKTSDDNEVTASMLKNDKELSKILKSDRGYRFLSSVRGTPPYWQRVQKDLLAMIRQLGIPTFFVSFSSADLRWPEVVNTILKQQGDTTRTAETMDWNEKCAVLRSNPVTAARMFDKRFHLFVTNVIKSKAKPIGKVVDSFFRVEFQLRGSPHIHGLVWIENAPKLDTDSDERVKEFVDEYITCHLPTTEEDEELKDILEHVQMHSKKHSKSCKKGRKECRFNFPRPPSQRTFVVRPKPDKDSLVMAKARDLVSSVKDKLRDATSEYNSIEELFEELNTSQEEFEKAYCMVAERVSIVHSRNLKSVWVNQYNKHVLRAWNANCDIQFVCDVYACVQYIVAYISKSERELGKVLQAVHDEISTGDNDSKKCMKELGHAFIKNREVSAQEAVYRVCGLSLKEFSRKVEFIPVGENPTRLSLPLSVIKSKSDDDDNIWAKNKVDRYKNRPHNEVFEFMCLATFCSEYRVLYGKQIKQQENIHKLLNGHGFVQKRTKKNAIIRYPRFNVETNTERFYQSMLQLFLPYRTNDELKPSEFKCYQQFFFLGSVQLNSKVKKVRTIVTRNKAFYEKDAESFDKAKEFLENMPEDIDAWSTLCPESEKSRLEEENDKDSVTYESDSEFAVPDLCTKDSSDSHHRIELLEPKLSEQDKMSLFRSMNTKQCEVFYKVREWCINKTLDSNIDPFFVFLTGGAGVGKSHLVRCIYTEATRILAKTSENPDSIVVLKVAPTGVAAFNIQGLTIHSAFSLPLRMRLPYVPLTEERLSSLRNTLSQVQIVIIDEISMVDQNIFGYIHGRLQQIKGKSSDFGHVSVIAVGDFYQLAPVGGIPLYNESVNSRLWHDNFKIIELDEIMRQKDDAEFANLLNKLRIRKRNEDVDEHDLSLLRSCEAHEYTDDVLHIYPKNKDVDAHNIHMLSKNFKEIKVTKAVDSNPKSNSIKKNKKEKVTLPEKLSIAVGVRVILTRNIDTSDGLSNGQIGTVKAFIEGTEPFTLKYIYVQFDNDKVGAKFRKTNKICKDYENSVRIAKVEEVHDNFKRLQFPLKLAYASTIHKVQGLSLEKCLFNMKGIFCAGQAYVGLSRLTSLKGLTLKEFDIKYIYCNESISESIAQMPHFLETQCTPSLSYEQMIILHNVQGLRLHFEDLCKQIQNMNADFICLTETWLKDEYFPLDVELSDYKSYHQPRHMAYNNSSEITTKLGQQSHGGVSCYGKIIKSFSRLHLTNNIENIAIHIVSKFSVLLVVIYRPASYKMSVFLMHLKNLVETAHNHSNKVIIMGDFNENYTQSSCLVKFFISYGYKQFVTNSTTERGTIIDHVYIRGFDLQDICIVPTYYSYHECIKILV